MCFHSKGNPPAFRVESGGKWKGVGDGVTEILIEVVKEGLEIAPFNVNVSGVTKISRDFDVGIFSSDSPNDVGEVGSASSF